MRSVAAPVGQDGLGINRERGLYQPCERAHGAEKTHK